MTPLSKNSATLKKIEVADASFIHAHSWVELSQANFFHNIRCLKKVVGQGMLGGVVKGDAYGHGLLQVSWLLEQAVDVAIILVVNVAEALLLRENGISKPICVLGYHNGSLEEAIKKDVHLVAYDIHSLRAILSAAKKVGYPAYIHVKVDTGMGRLGFLPHEVLLIVAQILMHDQAKWVGILSHLSDANNPDISYVHKQAAVFDKVLDNLQEKYGVLPPYVHINASGGCARLESSRYTLTRVGTHMYGYWKCAQQSMWYAERGHQFTLRQLMTWKTKIMHLKNIPAGNFIGYECSYRASRAMQVAVVPVGYADGYPLRVSQGTMLLHGVHVPIVGRVSMNYITLDVTDVPRVNIGDEVVILGNYPGITATDIAQIDDTLTLYTLTSINPSLPRVII